MKQILQDVGTGKVSVYDVPSPGVQRGRLLVRTAASLISAGTEKLVVESGQKSLLSKAKERPDLVKQVIQKARTEGILNTFTAVKAKLDSKGALGSQRRRYCCCSRRRCVGLQRRRPRGMRGRRLCFTCRGYLGTSKSLRDGFPRNSVLTRGVLARWARSHFRA